MVDAMKVKRSIYFATLQGYVIFETKLYNNNYNNNNNNNNLYLKLLHISTINISSVEL